LETPAPFISDGECRLEDSEAGYVDKGEVAQAAIEERAESGMQDGDGDAFED
jgi:hypothetical protein